MDRGTGRIKDLLKNDPKYKDMDLVEVAYGNDVPQKSVTECQALLAKYPDLDGLMAPTSVAVAAAGQVFESLGVYPGGSAGKHILLMGTGLPNETRRFVKEGAIQEDVLWDPSDIGYASAYLATGLVKKTITLGEGKTFAAGKLGTLTFRKTNLVICGGPKIFTKDNIDEFKFLENALARRSARLEGQAAGLPPVSHGAGFERYRQWNCGSESSRPSARGSQGKISA